MSCFQGISSNRSWNQWNSKQGEGGKNREKSNESFSSCLLDYHCSSEHQNHIILCVWGKINHIASRKWGGRSTPNPHLSSICFKPSAETQWTNLERNHALNIMGLVEKSGAGWRRVSGNQFLREFGGLIFMWAVGNPLGGFAIQRIRSGLLGAPSSLRGRKLALWKRSTQKSLPAFDNWRSLVKKRSKPKVRMHFIVHIYIIAEW